MPNPTLSFLLVLLFVAVPTLGRIPLSLDTPQENEVEANPRIAQLLKQECKTDVIKAFGIPSNLKKGILAGQSELEFCPKNLVSCCSGKELEATIPTFHAAYLKLKNLLEPLEELSTLFTGEKFADEILAPLVPNSEESAGITAKRDACINKHAVLPNKKTFQFDTNGNDSPIKFVVEMTALLAEKEFLEKRVAWYYGDLICSICNAEDQEYLESTADSLTVKAHSATCSELFDMQEFELRLGMLYAKFLKPVLNTYMCFTADEKEPPKDDDYLPDIGTAHLLENIIQYLKCFGEFTTAKNSDCVKFCDSTLVEYKFSSEILNGYLRSLEIVFPVLTGLEVQDYYADRKGMTFPEKLEGTVRFFDVKGVAPEKMKVSFEEKGINVFVNHWSKKYRSYKNKDKSVQTE